MGLLATAGPLVRGGMCWTGMSSGAGDTSFPLVPGWLATDARSRPCAASTAAADEVPDDLEAGCSAFGAAAAPSAGAGAGSARMLLLLLRVLSLRSRTTACSLYSRISCTVRSVSIHSQAPPAVLHN